MLVAKAFNLAEQYHSGQRYGDRPFIVHPNVVYLKLTEYYPNDEVLHSAGILHDIIEDTNCNYSIVKETCGLEVAEIVYAVTDELGRNRKERKEKTYPKIKENKKALIVKIADRISNVKYSVERLLLEEKSMFKMYLKEHKDFIEELHIYNDETIKEMFAELNYLIEFGKKGMT